MSECRDCGTPPMAELNTLASVSALARSKVRVISLELFFRRPELVFTDTGSYGLPSGLEPLDQQQIRSSHLHPTHPEAPPLHSVQNLVLSWTRFACLGPCAALRAMGPGCKQRRCAFAAKCQKTSEDLAAAIAVFGVLFSQEERKACLAKALLTLSRSAAVDRTLHFELFQFPCTSSLRQPAQVHRGERSAKSHGGKCLGDEQCAHRLLQSVRLLDIATSPALCARTVRDADGA